MYIIVIHFSLYTNWRQKLCLNVVYLWKRV